jgi:hypothetical protein
LQVHVSSSIWLPPPMFSYTQVIIVVVLLSIGAAEVIILQVSLL